VNRLHQAVSALPLDSWDPRLPFGFRLAVVLRKTYSLIAFAIIGIGVAYSVTGPRGRRLVVATVGVALISTVIEILQKYVRHSTESFASNCIDVLLGAVGGLFGAWLAEQLQQRKATM
jgi:hypothetical protein